MPTIRTTEEVSALVEEAVKIDKAIMNRLANEDPNTGFLSIYDDSGSPDSRGSELSSIATSERVQRLVSTLIEEESLDDQTTRLEAKWDLLNEDVDKLRKLGDPDEIGTGIRTVQPWSEISFALLYKKFIEEGAVLELDVEITEEQRQEALDKYKEYIDSFISNFNQYRGF